MTRENGRRMKRRQPFLFFNKNFSKKCLTGFMFYDIISNCQADMAQAVEHILGKDEVPSSNLGISSRKRKDTQ